MKQYLDLLEEIRFGGELRFDRTGVGTVSKFCRTMRFDLRDRFPILLSKRVNFHAVRVELAWMLQGRTDIQFLNHHGVFIWDLWADKNGDLGPLYGSQYRHCEGKKRTVDQLSNIVEQLKKDPHSRRHVATTWHAPDLADMQLAPCHGTVLQFYVSGDLDDPHLSCSMYQRSADMFLGLPFNMASYAALLHIVAAMVGMKPYEFVWIGGDCHVYLNHFEAVRLQLENKDNPSVVAPERVPKLVLNHVTPETSFDEISPYRMDVVDYEPLKPIKAPIAV